MVCMCHASALVDDVSKFGHTMLSMRILSVSNSNISSHNNYKWCMKLVKNQFTKDKAILIATTVNVLLVVCVCSVCLCVCICSLVQSMSHQFETQQVCLHVNACEQTTDSRKTSTG